MKKNSRRNFLISATGLIASALGIGWYLKNKKAPIGFEVNQETITKGRELLKGIISADIHAHPGRSFVEDGQNLSAKLKLYSIMGSFEENVIADMLEGGITVSSFSTVADFQILDIKNGGIIAFRDFKQGEAWESYQIQIKTLKELLKNKQLQIILTPDDVLKAKQANKIGMFLTSEGGDFLEGSLERFDQCYADGIRSMTIMHYNNNEIGDIQTEPPQHNTLTPFGISLVKEMNKKGMIVDLAHSAKKTALKAMEVTDKPVMISHTAIRSHGFDHERFIDLDEAKLAAETGGIIGAWPTGLGLKSFSEYIDQIFRQIDLIGVDHISIGTDMDSNYKPVMGNYTLLPLLAGTLLERGMNPIEAEKVLGGNFMRVFKEVAGSTNIN